MRSCGQQGMSLIELMIGLVVGLIILLGIVQTMMVSKSASMSRQSMSAIAENARFAFEFMSRDLRMAGYEYECTAGEGDAIQLGGGVLTACYQDSNADDVRASYSINNEGELIYRKEVDGNVVINNEVLIDGVSQFDLRFGQRTSDGNIQYITTLPASPTELIAVRVTLAMGDPTDGRALEVENNTISGTIALRNQIIQMMNES
jgi:prepilin-type N-terminal cleavage/methylation domain-containing protein